MMVQFIEECKQLDEKRKLTTGERKVNNYVCNDFAGLIKKWKLDFNHYSIVHSEEFITELLKIWEETAFFGSFKKNEAKEKTLTLLEKLIDSENLTYKTAERRDHAKYHVTFYTWLSPREDFVIDLCCRLGTLGK